MEKNDKNGRIIGERIITDKLSVQPVYWHTDDVQTT